MLGPLATGLTPEEQMDEMQMAHDFLFGVIDPYGEQIFAPWEDLTPEQQESYRNWEEKPLLDGQEA